MARPRPPLWRRRRVQLIALGVVVLLAAIALKVAASQSAPQPQAATQPAAPLVAHGQVAPVRQAHVGTQAGGVVQRLDVSPGDKVAAQTPLALVVSTAGTELVTAPFDGTVTNVLVHTGDTLLPGATIAVVADLHVLQVETSDVDEFLVSKVAVGQRVQLSIDALDSLAINGTVTNVALLPQSGGSGSPAYPVTISVGGFPPEVRAGMSVRVIIPDSQSPPN
jgi:multidrug resistance efflux pump